MKKHSFEILTQNHRSVSECRPYEHQRISQNPGVKRDCTARNSWLCARSDMGCGALDYYPINERKEKKTETEKKNEIISELK